MTVRKESSEEGEAVSDAEKMRTRIIKRAALEFEDGMYGILELTQAVLHMYIQRHKIRRFQPCLFFLKTYIASVNSQKY